MFFISHDRRQILKRTDAHTLNEVDEIELLPQVGAKVYSGSVDGVVLKSGYSPFASLPIGTKQEVERKIADLKLNKQYRRVCFDLFVKEAEVRGFVDTNTTLKTAFFYMTPRVLFDRIDSFSSRMYNHDGQSTFFTPFSELTSDINMSNSLLHIGMPIRRHIQCSIDTTLFRENTYYRQRMENNTMVNGVLLKDVEGEGEESVYRVNKQALKNLKYLIEKEDQEENIEIELIIPSSNAISQLGKQCTSHESPTMEFSDSFILQHIQSLVVCACCDLPIGCFK